MIDVTEEVETKVLQRVNGGMVRDELWHKGKKIGVMEAQGPVLQDRDYILKLLPSQRFNLVQRILQLEDGDMAT